MKTADQSTQIAWGPVVQVALEQRFPPQRIVIHDPLAYPVLPVYLKLLVKVAGTSPLREMLLGLIDRKVPGALHTADRPQHPRHGRGEVGLRRKSISGGEFRGEFR